ncbi:MAG TPA: M48 family metalloprotease [Patescibacteria group bacterium]|nr:M48 family metalloprotease [Patescibacteria group bacterium]
MKLQEQVNYNKIKTWLIMLLFAVLIPTVVYIFVKALGYSLSYVWIALFFSVLTSIGSFYFSDKLVLATAGAKPATKEQYPEYFSIVEKLSKEDGLPMPKLYVINDSSMNAFATGRSPQNAVVAATSGILENMNRTELEGVLAHELSHVKNFDIRLMAIVSVLVGFIAMLSNIFMNSLFFGGNRDRDEKNNSQAIFLVIGIIFAILTPLVATLIQLAVSRKREFLADASGALLTKYPEGLALALVKLEKDTKPLKNANNATAHLFITNPFKAKSKDWITSLFMTHPPLEERIKILRSM